MLGALTYAQEMPRGGGEESSALSSQTPRPPQLRGRSLSLPLLLSFPESFKPKVLNEALHPQSQKGKCDVMERAKRPA